MVNTGNEVLGMDVPLSFKFGRWCVRKERLEIALGVIGGVSHVNN